MREPLRGLFVVGTDTGVGKTRIASGIIRTMRRAGRRVGAVKPVATGATREGEGWTSEDGRALIAALGGGLPHESVVPLCYEEPLAPCVAARRRGTTLESETLNNAVGAALGWWVDQGAESLIVEGIGGLLCPLAEGTTVADLAVSLDYPLVIVARAGLGTLNHTLMTVEAARTRSLRIAGLVINASEPSQNAVAEGTNPEELSRRLPGVAILAQTAYDPEHLSYDPLGDVDWYERTARPRP